jgi:hypothetical protein
MQLNFSTIYDFLETITTTINNLSTTVVHVATDSLNTIADSAQSLVDIAQACIDDPDPEKCKANAEEGRDSTKNTRKEGRDTTTNMWSVGWDNVNNTRKEGYKPISLLDSWITEDINYVDYPQAKQRLENVLAILTTQTSSDNTTLQQIKTISNTINAPSDIQPNQQGVSEIKTQITNLINTEQNKLLALNLLDHEAKDGRESDNTKTIENSYDKLLAMLEQSELEPAERNEPKANESSNTDTTNLAFNFNLFNLDPTTEKLLTTAENPYKTLFENKAPIIDAFLETLEGNTPADLQMTPIEYQTQKSNLTTLKHQLAGFYQTTQLNQQTKLIAKTSSSEI